MCDVRSFFKLSILFSKHVAPKLFSLYLPQPFITCYKDTLNNQEMKSNLIATRLHIQRRSRESLNVVMTIPSVAAYRFECLSDKPQIAVIEVFQKPEVRLI